MVLSDKDLKKALKSGRIQIKPEPDLKVQLGSCSIDLRLGNTFRVFEHSRNAYIDPLENQKSRLAAKRAKIKNQKSDKRMLQQESFTREIIIEDGFPFIMQPGDFVLASTLETIKIAPDLLGRLEGRSSLGRLGIVVHSTASIFEPGWDGKAVLELGNLGRMAVSLHTGMRICAMTFEELSSPAEVPYNKKGNAKYVGQNGPEESRINEDNKQISQ